MGSDPPLSVELIESLPYVQLLALMGESNLPPGGFKTIHRLISFCTLGVHSNVLHAGCNAGFLSRELARISGCRVTGIDIAPEMVDAATRRASSEGLDGRVRHECRDMRDTQFQAETFDVTLSGGALAFVVDQPRAIEEWIRVTRPYGILADAELYYREPAPESLREKVSRIIGAQVPAYNKSYWPALFSRLELVPYACYDEPVQVRTEAEVFAYCDRMVEWRASHENDAVQAALRSRIRECFLTFNENLAYMSYQVLAYRRLPKGSEPFLFI